MKSRKVAVLVCAIFAGLVFLAAGIGKLPGQAEFAEILMGSFYAQWMASVISHVLPWLEILIGISLLLGVFPRIAALVSLPIIIGFITNNIWALSQGIGRFTRCGDCFGFWEDIFGAMTPLSALVIDILLLGASLTVALLYPDFFKFRFWFSKVKDI